MIVKERVTIGTRDFVNTYSDKYLLIERDGSKYSSATDLPELGYEYTETDERIFSDEECERLPAEMREKVLAAYAGLGK